MAHEIIMGNAQPGSSGRHVSGLRWTLWLSLLTAPCGYAISIMLARISPEAVGEYGLLSLYVSITSVFLFLGGPAAVMRFMPGLTADGKVAFFWSYLAVAALTTLPFQLSALIWPGTLHYIFGDVGSPGFHVMLLWFADFYILFNLAIAALKSVMELKLAQLLLRAVTLVSFIVYGFLYLLHPRFIAAHYHAIIWLVYFFVTGVMTAIALVRFLKFVSPAHRVGFQKLPQGFWRYTLGLQASSALGFLGTRLDYLFIVNAAGVATLGRYVALMTLVLIVPMFATFVLDSYLPSLSALMSAGDVSGSEKLTRTYVRLILLLGLCMISFVSVFAGPLVRILGARYADLTGLLRIALPFAGVQIANWIIGTVFSGIGYPQRDAIAKALRSVLFVVVFWPLWNSMHLLGAVWAWGIAETAYQAASLLLLVGTVRFRLSLYGAYIPMLMISVAIKYVTSWLGSFGLPLGLLVWLVSMAMFLAAGRYTVAEIRAFWHALMPGRRVMDSEVFAAIPGASAAA